MSAEILIGMFNLVLLVMSESCYFVVSLCLKPVSSLTSWKSNSQREVTVLVLMPFPHLGSKSRRRWTCHNVTRTGWDTRTRFPRPRYGYDRRLLIPRPIRAEDARFGRTEKLLWAAKNKYGHRLASLQRRPFQSLVVVSWEYFDTARVQSRGWKNRRLSAVAVPSFQPGRQLQHAPLQPGARRRVSQRELGPRSEIQRSGRQLGVRKWTAE